jgi:hypothetical protein
MRALFTLLDRVQESWPRRLALSYMHLAPPPDWAQNAALQVTTDWTIWERQRYRAELNRLVQELSLLHRRWLVTMTLALLLATVVVLAAVPAGALTETSAGVLAAVLCAIVLPPFVICNGIARDYMAAQALLVVCRPVAATAHISSHHSNR